MATHDAADAGTTNIANYPGSGEWAVTGLVNGTQWSVDLVETLVYPGERCLTFGLWYRKPGESWVYHKEFFECAVQMGGGTVWFEPVDQRDSGNLGDMYRKYGVDLIRRFIAIINNVLKALFGGTGTEQPPAASGPLVDFEAAKAALVLELKRYRSGDDHISIVLK